MLITTKTLERMKAMAQINFTLEYEFLVGLFSENKDAAFGKLMEAILNQVLRFESEEQLGAENYQRSSNRKDYRNGTRPRGLTTRIGKIELEVPRHRNVPFRTMLFENYQRNEQALITTMMEMVVQGVSTRNVKKVTEELCGESFSKATVSEICKELDIPVKEFKNRPLTARYPFVIADAMYIKVREDHRVVSKAFMIAMGINTEGRKEIIGFDICDSEREMTWKGFFENLKERGLKNVDLITSDDHSGLVAAVKECFPGASWQRCQAHFTRNILDKMPKKYRLGFAEQLRELFNVSTIEEARKIRNELYDEYYDVAKDAMETLDQGFEDAMIAMALPSKYRKVMRTSNLIERENAEIRRRERVVQIFPNKESALRLLGAVLMDHNNEWQIGRVFIMDQYLEKRFEIKKNMNKIKGA